MTTQQLTNARPVPAPLAVALYARSILTDCAHKIIRQRKRTSTQVQSDYDKGEWTDFQAARSWEQAANLEDYVYSTSRRPLRAQVDGRLQKLPMCDYYRYRTERILALLSEFDLGSERLVELGSGAGRNLFAAALAKRWKVLRGLELSPTGIAIANTVAQHFRLDGISAGPIDLLNPQSLGFAELKDSVVFTHYCLEQLPAHTETVLRNLVNAGVRRVIHIEPTLELFNSWSLKDLASIAYIWRQNYLADLVTTTQRLEREGLLQIFDVRRLDFAPTLRNTPTLVVWEPASTAGASR